MRVAVLCFSFLSSGMGASTAVLRKHCGEDCLLEAQNTIMEKVMPEKKAFFEKLRRAQVFAQYPELENVSCVDGFAGEFPCSKIDLLHFLSHNEIRGQASKARFGNDIWGWTDPMTNVEYILSGQEDQTTILKVTEGNMQPLAR